MKIIPIFLFFLFCVVTSYSMELTKSLTQFRTITLLSTPNHTEKSEQSYIIQDLALFNHFDQALKSNSTQLDHLTLRSLIAFKRKEKQDNTTLQESLQSSRIHFEQSSSNQSYYNRVYNYWFTTAPSFDVIVKPSLYHLLSAAFLLHDQILQKQLLQIVVYEKGSQRSAFAIHPQKLNTTIIGTFCGKITIKNKSVDAQVLRQSTINIEKIFQTIWHELQKSNNDEKHDNDKKFFEKMIKKHFNNHKISKIAISPDGRLIAAGINHSVEIYNLAAPDALQPIIHEVDTEYKVTDIAINPDNQHITYSTVKRNDPTSCTLVFFQPMSQESLQFPFHVINTK